MYKIIIGIEENIISMQDMTIKPINDILSIGNTSEIYTKEISSLKLEDNYFIKLENNKSIKLSKLSQLEQIPKYVNRLFCFIDDKNNLYLPSVNITQILGNLEVVDNNLFVRKKKLLDDFIFFPQEILSKSISLVKTISDANFLESFFKFNSKTNFNNCYFGYIDSVMIATEEDVDEDDYLNVVTVGEAITKKLYENITKIKIIAQIKDCVTYSTDQNINDIVLYNNKNISKNNNSQN